MSFPVTPVTRMGEYLPDFTGFVVDTEKYEALKSIIEVAKAQNKAEVFRKPTRTSGILEKDVRASLHSADESFECQEWPEASIIYHQLNERKLGPKSVASKLSLCYARCSEYPEAFTLSKQAIIDTPLESNAYISMAIIKSHIRCFDESERLLQLAELTLNPNTTLINTIRLESPILAEKHKAEIAAFRHMMNFNPNFIESYKESIDHNELHKFDVVLSSMTRVKENPDCLEEEIQSNAGFCSDLAENWFCSDLVAPRHFDDESSRQFVQNGSPFHSVNSSMFLSILKYLSYRDLVMLRRTCRYLEYIGGFPDNFKLIVTRLGIGDIPTQDWSTKRHESEYHLATRIFQIINSFLAFYSPSAPQFDFEKENDRQSHFDQLRQFHFKFHLDFGHEYCLSPMQIWGMISERCSNWTENLYAKSLTRRPELWQAIEFALTVPSPNYFRTFRIIVDMFVNLVVLGHMDLYFPASIVNNFWSLLYSQVGVDSGAALAVCHNFVRLSQMNLMTVCSLDAHSASSAHRSKYFVLDGIWQGVQNFVSDTLKDIREECLMNLKFPSVGQVMDSERSAFEMIGTGIDTFGEFELEDPIFDISTFEVSFRKVYRHTNEHDKPIKHFYSGKLYPSGIGGIYGAPTDNNSVHLLGVFFYGRPLACANAADGYSPSFRDMSHTATMSWNDLLPSISNGAEKNAKVKRRLFEQFQVDSSTKVPFYELKVFHESPSLANLRNAIVASLQAQLPSTTMDEMRAYLEGEQEPKKPCEIRLDRFPTDSDTKWALRCKMTQIARVHFTSATLDIGLRNMATLTKINKILKQYNFDMNEMKVLFALQEYARIIKVVAPSLFWSAKSASKFIDQLETLTERRRAQTVPDSVTNFFSEAVRRRKQDSGSMTITNSSQRNSAMSSTLIVSAVAACGLVLIGALAVGRLISKHKSSN